MAVREGWRPETEATAEKALSVSKLVCLSVVKPGCIC